MVVYGYPMNEKLLQALDDPANWREKIKDVCAGCFCIIDMNDDYHLRTREQRYADRGNFCTRCNREVMSKLIPSHLKPLQSLPEGVETPFR